MTSKSLTWEEACLKVLEEADTPLHYTEVFARIDELGLVNYKGVTPAVTVNSVLHTLYRGKKVLKPSKSTFAKLSLKDQVTAEIEEEDERETEEAISAGESTPDQLQVTYGLLWDRASVDWGPSPENGRLYGSQKSATPVDFAKQDGIYLLHFGNEVVYVGQTLTGKEKPGFYSRLREHNRDSKKSPRWDKFSWFGFRRVVDDAGNLSDMPKPPPMEEVLNVIEAILIEGLTPRLNSQAGNGVDKWVFYEQRSVK